MNYDNVKSKDFPIKTFNFKRHKAWSAKSWVADYHFVLFPGSMDLISLDLAASFTETLVTIPQSVPLWIVAIYSRYVAKV